MATLNTQQILIPKKVYIGDSAELRITFNCQKEVTSYNFIHGLDFKNYTINDVSLTKTGLNFYQLSINFVPWKTGDIVFPDCQLVLAENESAGVASGEPVASAESAGTAAASADSYTIHIEPVNIVSLVEQNQVIGLRASTNPMLIPGTTYKIWGTIIGFVLILIVGIRLIVKHKQIALAIKNRKLIRKYKKNKKRTIKALDALLKQINSQKSDENAAAQVNATASDSRATTPANTTTTISVAQTAAEIQKIMRNYLEVRFEYPFTKTVSSEIMSGFEKATGGLASDEKMEAAENVSGIFTRTDYLRYKNNATLESDDEFTKMIETLKNQIETLEFVPKTNSENDDFTPVEMQGDQNV